MHPTERLNVVLSAQEWNAVMALLGEQAFKLVAPLIGQIQAQCESHAQLLEMQRQEDNERIEASFAPPDVVPGQGAARNRAKPKSLHVVEPAAATSDEPAA